VFDKIKVLYDRRDLIRNLVYRDLDVKYKGSVLGFFWSLLNPICMLIVYTIAFKYILNNGIQRFPLFFMSGYLPWMFFSSTLSLAVTSIIFNPNLVQKIYFPREILPISNVLASLLEFILHLLIFLPIVIIFTKHVGFEILFLPLVIILHTLFLAGLALLVSSLCVYFRDVKHLLDVLLMMWFWLTPIVYEASFVDSMKISNSLFKTILKVLILHNPLSSFIVSYKDIIMYGFLPGYAQWSEMIFFAFLTFYIGLYVFNKLSKEFAENV
jgi:lipopolysaccharide transport system permease protein